MAFAVTLPADDSLPPDEAPVLALSSDSRTLLYTAIRGHTRQLFRRSLDRVEAQRIAGTEGATNPFPSPDGRWVGFIADGKLKKVGIEGGHPTTLCSAPNHRGAAWAPDGSIIAVPTVDTGLMRVPDTGGTPQPLTKPDAARNERTHRWPHILPDGKSVLFTIGMLDSPGDYDGAKIGLASLETGKWQVVFEGARMAAFAEPGYLLGLRGTRLLAARLDPSRPAMVSGAAVALEGVGGDPSCGAGYIALAWDGTLAYVPASTLPNDLSLVLVDRSGRMKPLPLPAQAYRYPRFSPDENQLAFTVGTRRGSEDDVWTYDLESGSLNRLTFDGASFGCGRYPDRRSRADDPLVSGGPGPDAVHRTVRDEDRAGHQLRRFPGRPLRHGASKRSRERCPAGERPRELVCRTAHTR